MANAQTFTCEGAMVTLDTKTNGNGKAKIKTKQNATSEINYYYDPADLMKMQSSAGDVTPKPKYYIIAGKDPKYGQTSGRRTWKALNISSSNPNLDPDNKSAARMNDHDSTRSRGQATGRRWYGIAGKSGGYPDKSSPILYSVNTDEVIGTSTKYSGKVVPNFLIFSTAQKDSVENKLLTIDKATPIMYTYRLDARPPDHSTPILYSTCSPLSVAQLNEIDKSTPLLAQAMVAANTKELDKSSPLLAKSVAKNNKELDKSSPLIAQAVKKKKKKPVTSTGQDNDCDGDIDLRFSGGITNGETLGNYEIKKGFIGSIGVRKKIANKLFLAAAVNYLSAETNYLTPQNLDSKYKAELQASNLSARTNTINVNVGPAVRFGTCKVGIELGAGAGVAFVNMKEMKVGFTGKNNPEIAGDVFSVNHKKTNLSLYANAAITYKFSPSVGIFLQPQFMTLTGKGLQKNDKNINKIINVDGQPNPEEFKSLPSINTTHNRNISNVSLGITVHPGLQTGRRQHLPVRL